jgi:hypothetical protein
VARFGPAGGGLAPSSAEKARENSVSGPGIANFDPLAGECIGRD